jgi:hypothetical protein
MRVDQLPNEGDVGIGDFAAAVFGDDVHDGQE